MTSRVSPSPAHPRNEQYDAGLLSAIDRFYEKLSSHQFNLHSRMKKDDGDDTDPHFKVKMPSSPRSTSHTPYRTSIVHVSCARECCDHKHYCVTLEQRCIAAETKLNELENDRIHTLRELRDVRRAWIALRQDTEELRSELAASSDALLARTTSLDVNMLVKDSVISGLENSLRLAECARVDAVRNADIFSAEAKTLRDSLYDKDTRINDLKKLLNKAESDVVVLQFENNGLSRSESGSVVYEDVKNLTSDQHIDLLWRRLIEAQNQCQHLSIELNRLNNVCRQHNDRAELLQKQVDTMTQNLPKQDLLKSKHPFYIGHSIAQLKEDIAVEATLARTPRDEMKSRDSIRDSVRDSVRDRERDEARDRERDRKRVMVPDSLFSNDVALKEQLSEALTRATKAENSVSDLEDEIDLMEEQLSSLKLKNENLQNNLGIANSELQSLKVVSVSSLEISPREARLRSLPTVASKSPNTTNASSSDSSLSDRDLLKRKLEIVLNDLDKLRKEKNSSIKALNSERDLLKQKLELALRDVDQIKQEKKASDLSADNQLKSLKIQLASLPDYRDIEKLVSSNKQLVDTVNALQKDIARYDLTVDNAIADREDALTKVREAENKILDMKERTAREIETAKHKANKEIFHWQNIAHQWFENSSKVGDYLEHSHDVTSEWRLKLGFSVRMVRDITAKYINLKSIVTKFQLDNDTSSLLNEPLLASPLPEEPNAALEKAEAKIFELEMQAVKVGRSREVLEAEVTRLRSDNKEYDQALLRAIRDMEILSQERDIQMSQLQNGQDDLGNTKLETTVDRGVNNHGNGEKFQAIQKSIPAMGTSTSEELNALRCDLESAKAISNEISQRNLFLQGRINDLENQCTSRKNLLASVSSEMECEKMESLSSKMDIHSLRETVSGLQSTIASLTLEKEQIADAAQSQSAVLQANRDKAAVLEEIVSLLHSEKLDIMKELDASRSIMDDHVEKRLLLEVLVAELQNDKGALSESNENISTELLSVRDALNEKTNESITFNSRCNTLKKLLDTSVLELDEVRIELDVLKGKMKDSGNLQRQYDDLKNLLDAIESTARDDDSKISLLEIEKNNQSKDIEAIVTLIRQKLSEMENIIDTSEELNQRNLFLQGLINDLENQCTSLKNSSEDEKLSNLNVSNQLSEKEYRMEVLLNENGRLKQEVNDLQELKSQLTQTVQSHEQDLSNNSKEASDRLTFLQQRVSELESQCTMYQTSLSSITSELDDAKIKVSSAVSTAKKRDSDLSSCRQQITDLELQCDNLQSQLSVEQKKLEDSLELLNAAEGHAKTVVDTLSNTSEEITNLRNFENQYRVEIDRLNKENSTLSSNLAERHALEASLSEKTNQMVVFLNENEQLKREVNDLQELKSQLTQTVQSHEQDLSNNSKEASDRLTFLQQRVSELESQCTMYQASLSLITSELDDAKIKVSSAISTVKKRDADLSSCRQQITDLELQCDNLQSQLSVEQKKLELLNAAVGHEKTVVDTLSNTSEEITNLRNFENQYRVEIDRLNKENSTLSSNFTERHALEVARRRIAELEAASSSISFDANAATTELKDLISSLLSANEDKAATIAKLTADLELKHNMELDLRKNISDVQASCDILKSEAAESAVTENALRRRLEELAVEGDQLNGRTKTLEIELANVKNALASAFENFESTMAAAAAEKSQLSESLNMANIKVGALTLSNAELKDLSESHLLDARHAWQAAFDAEQYRDRLLADLETCRRQNESLEAFIRKHDEEKLISEKSNEELHRKYNDTIAYVSIESQKLSYSLSLFDLKMREYENDNDEIKKYINDLKLSRVVTYEGSKQIDNDFKAIETFPFQQNNENTNLVHDLELETSLLKSRLSLAESNIENLTTRSENSTQRITNFISNFNSIKSEIMSACTSNVNSIPSITELQHNVNMLAQEDRSGDALSSEIVPKEFGSSIRAYMIKEITMRRVFGALRRVDSLHFACLRWLSNILYSKLSKQQDVILQTQRYALSCKFEKGAQVLISVLGPLLSIQISYSFRLWKEFTTAAILEKRFIEKQEQEMKDMMHLIQTDWVAREDMLRKKLSEAMAEKEKLSSELDIAMEFVHGGVAIERLNIDDYLGGQGDDTDLFLGD